MNRKIVNLAIPSIISNITVPLLGLVDVAITGHLGETAYIGAVAIGGLFFNILYWNFGFLRMGTSGLTAQAYGKNDEKAMTIILIQALTVGLIAALFILLLQYPVERLGFYLLDTTAEIEQYAVTYIRILVWGAPAILMLYGFKGWFIGMQNSRYQMYVTVVMNISNIVLSLLFVYVFDMKIEGVALGTLLAQYSGLILAVFLWAKKYGYMRKHIRFKESLHLARMRRFFAVNRDIFIRTTCLIAVTMFFTYSGTKQGEVALAVNTLLMQLFTLFSYFMDGFAYAGEAVVGRYCGAKNLVMLRKAVKALFTWGISLAVVFTALYAIGGNAFLHLLTNDAVVLEEARKYFYWVLAIPPAGFAAFIWDGVLIGATATRYMLYAMLIAVIAFFSIIFLFSGMSNNHALWLAFIVYLALRGIMQTFYSPKIFNMNFLEKLQEK